MAAEPDYGELQPSDQISLAIRVPESFPNASTHPDTSYNDARASEAMTKQIHTRPISQQELATEAKGIYAGLLLLEAKCIEVDKEQCSNRNTKLNDEQWQALLALHRTLLHEHYDLFLALHHHAASPALQGLASKYAMPARMWRHGIHSFLELLRLRLPSSLEYILFFIYFSYGIMTSLYEAVPTFKDIWMECLGDLGRYRHVQICVTGWRYTRC